MSSVQEEHVSKNRNPYPKVVVALYVFSRQSSVEGGGADGSRQPFRAAPRQNRTIAKYQRFLTSHQITNTNSLVVAWIGLLPIEKWLRNKKTRHQNGAENPSLLNNKSITHCHPSIKSDP